MVFLVSQVWVQVLVMTFRGPGIQLGTWQVLLNVQMFWPGFRVKMFWPGFRVNSNDPDSGSIQMTRIPGQCKWPGFRVNANDPDSGSMQMTRIPGQFKWPGFRVNANDPDSGSIIFDPESGSKHLNIQKDPACTHLDSGSMKCHGLDLNPHLANQKHQSLSAVHLTTRPRSPQKWQLRPLVV